MSADLSSDGIAPEDWKYLHPLTYLPRVAGSLGGVAAATVWALQWGSARVVGEGGSAWAASVGSLPVLLGLALVAAGALLALSYLSWRMTRYAITPSAVWFRSGILSRSQRHARVSRIQSVNLSYSLLGRIVGLGYLDIEVAGGAESSIKLGLLPSSRLEELRALLLGLASGAIDELVPPADPARAAGQGRPLAEATLEAPERVVFRVSVLELVGSMLATMSTVLALAIGVGLCILNAFLIVSVGVTSVMSFAAIMFGAVSVVAGVWARFDREFGFTAAISADGVRIRRGLTARRHVTIPPGRIHALSVSQPLLWRLFGWYRVEITQAGNRTSSEGEKNEGMRLDVASDVLLPVGSRAEVAQAIAMVVPSLGVDEPNRFLESLHAGSRADRWMIPIPPSARILDPFTYARRACALTETVLAIRGGWLTRTFSIIPLSRIQSVSMRQGPLQGWRGVASVRAELVPGRVPSLAAHVEASRALDLWSRLSVASKSSRDAEPPERWLSRVGEVVDATLASEAGGA